MNEIRTATAGLVSQAIATRDVKLTRLADKTLIPRTTLQRKVAGDADFTVSELARIAHALDMHPGELLPLDFSRQAVAA